MTYFKVAAAFVLLSLAGCATTKKYEKVLDSWVGSTEASLVQSWGPPDSVYDTPGGGKMLTWSNSSTRISSHYNQYTRTVNSYTHDYSCKTTMTVDAEGKVTDWRWEGNTCKSK